MGEKRETGGKKTKLQRVDASPVQERKGMIPARGKGLNSE